ncbi:MAG: hypothetical protein ACJA00_004493, partial [Myxococcota bacterium]
MSSPVFNVLACLFLVGCSELSGEWAITAVELDAGSLSDLDGTVVVEPNGTATLVLQSGDLDGDFLVINVEGVADVTGDDEFSLILTGFQEVPQNAIFVDLNLQCVSTEVDAACTG